VLAAAGLVVQLRMTTANRRGWRARTTSKAKKG